MKRKSYDRWGIEITSFNRNITFYVECDCGELAKSVYQKNYFYCPKWGTWNIETKMHGRIKI